LPASPWGSSSDGKIVAPVTEPVGEPVVEPREMPRGAGLAEVIPLRPTGMGRIAEAARM
jgi:hypothetical protein